MSEQCMSSALRCDRHAAATSDGPCSCEWTCYRSFACYFDMMHDRPVPLHLPAPQTPAHHHPLTHEPVHSPACWSLARQFMCDL